MMEYIASVQGTGSAATLTFTGIPNTYNSLVMKGVGHTTHTSQDLAKIRFNSDTGYNYVSNRGGRDGTNNYAFQGGGISMAPFAYTPSASLNVGTMLFQLDMNIWSYQKASTRPGCTSFMCQANYRHSDSAQIGFLYSGWYKGDNTVDVTTINLIMTSGNWGSNTKLDLYGRTDS